MSQGSTTPGAPVTAVLGTDGIITLFLADPGGGVYAASGNRTEGYGRWTTVSQGSTTPGAPVTAVLGTDGIITLFLADPGGGVYTASGNRTEGYGRWTTVSQGSTTPGAPVTAVLGTDGTYTLFLANPGGSVFTAGGSPAGGWGDWTPVSQGVSQASTTPGAPVTAVRHGRDLHVVPADPWRVHAQLAPPAGLISLHLESLAFSSGQGGCQMPGHLPQALAAMSRWASPP